MKGSGDRMCVDEGAVETRFLELCQSSKSGITAKQAMQAIPGLCLKKIVAVVNKLSKSGKIELSKVGNELVYTIKSKPRASAPVGGDGNEKLVYKLIEDSGSKGLYPMDIKVKAGLSILAVNKALKSLETRQAIKSHLSIQGRDMTGKKKIYLLVSIVPDSSITGGTFYDNNDIESEYVSVLLNQTYRFLLQRLKASEVSGRPAFRSAKDGWVSVDDVLSSVSSLGICRVEMSVAETHNLLQNLVFEGRAETSCRGNRLFDESERQNPYPMYRALSKDALVPTGLTSVPCAFCTVHQECRINGTINPRSCEYMKKWLQNP